MRKNKRKKYSANEKRAYFTGFGVGLTGNSPSSDRDTRRLKNFLTDKEFNSYMKGYEKGLDNPSLRAGIRNPKKWF